MNNRTRNHQRATEILDNIGTHHTVIAQHLHVVIDRAAIDTTPDGHRRYASGATIEHEGQPRAEDPNDPTTWACDRSDPTGEAVIATAPADPLAEATRRIARRLEQVERDMATLAEQLANLVDPGRTADPDKWCVSCLRIGKCSPRVKGGRKCSSCRDFRSAWRIRFDPPVEILRHYHERGKWPSMRAIEQAIADERKKTPETA